MVADNLKSVLSKLPPEVKLVAVSKFHPAEDILEAYNAGQRRFGENRPQEFAAKVAGLPGDIEWHFIGHLQTNKLKLVLPYASLVESVDSQRLLDAIEKWGSEHDKVIDVLLELHLGAEETKGGFTEEEIEQKMDDILSFADIGQFVYQPVKTYSSGMFVRLAFAVAINIDPEILIVDEALSVGDVFFQSKCYKKFEEFKASGKTILFVSHDLSSISKYCDRVILLNQGDKLGEGSPKEMIDVYKQVLVGQYNANASKADITQASKRVEEAFKLGVNPDTLEYGSKKAGIVNCRILDANGVETNAIIKGTDFTIEMDVDIYEDVPSPIFAYSFKNIRGTEITGTNTMFEKAFSEPLKAGDKRAIKFTQNMSLQGGEYLLSLGLTGYEEGEFTVYHRLYDVINITVISDKNTVGYYDMNSKITIGVR